MQLSYDVDGNAYVADQNGVNVADTPYGNIQESGNIIPDIAEQYTVTFYYHRNASNRDLRLVNNETQAAIPFTGKIIKIFGKSESDLVDGDTSFEIKVNGITVYTITNAQAEESFEVYPDISVEQGNELKVRIVGDSINKPLVYVVIQQ